MQAIRNTEIWKGVSQGKKEKDALELLFRLMIFVYYYAQVSLRVWETAI